MKLAVPAERRANEARVAATPDTVKRLKGLGLERVLIVVDKHDEKLCLAAHNIPDVDVLTAAEVDPMSLVRFDKVLATAAAVRGIEERLS